MAALNTEISELRIPFSPAPHTPPQPPFSPTMQAPVNPFPAIVTPTLVLPPPPLAVNSPAPPSLPPVIQSALPAQQIAVPPIIPAAPAQQVAVPPIIPAAPVQQVAVATTTTSLPPIVHVIPVPRSPPVETQLYPTPFNPRRFLARLRGPRPNHTVLLGHVAWARSMLGVDHVLEEWRAFCQVEYAAIAALPRYARFIEWARKPFPPLMQMLADPEVSTTTREETTRRLVLGMVERAIGELMRYMEHQLVEHEMDAAMQQSVELVLATMSPILDTCTTCGTRKVFSGHVDKIRDVYFSGEGLCLVCGLQAHIHDDGPQRTEAQAWIERHPAAQFEPAPPVPVAARPEAPERKLVADSNAAPRVVPPVATAEERQLVVSMEDSSDILVESPRGKKRERSASVVSLEDSVDISESSRGKKRERSASGTTELPTPKRSRSSRLFEPWAVAKLLAALPELVRERLITSTLKSLRKLSPLGRDKRHLCPTCSGSAPMEFANFGLLQAHIGAQHIAIDTMYAAFSSLPISISHLFCFSRKAVSDARLDEAEILPNY